MTYNDHYHQHFISIAQARPIQLYEFSRPGHLDSLPQSHQWNSPFFLPPTALLHTLVSLLLSVALQPLTIPFISAMGFDLW